jgi:hypothetical protein
MATLTGHLVADTYKALLKLIDNDIVTAAEKQISDGLGGGTNVFIDQNGFLRANKYKVTGATSSQFLKGDGSLDSTAYLPVGTTTTNIPEGANLYFTTNRVLNTLLTGFSPVTGTVTASDSILTAINKIWWNIVNGGGGGGGGYVPYSGALQSVNLGEWGLTTGFVSFDTTPTGTPTTAGTMSWNDQDGTADLKLKGGNVTLQIGQEQVLRVVNKTGATLAEADFRAVRIRSVAEGGAQGQRLAVVLAQGDNDPDSATTIGLVTESILNNEEGFITTSGEVKKIDTTGAKSYGGLETWVDGDVLYLSPTHPGYLTKVKPQAPDHTIIVGWVVYAHANNGKIFVKVDNGYELDELHNVKITAPVANDDFLMYDETESVWINKDLHGVEGYLPYYGVANVFEQSPIFTDASQVIIGSDTEFATGNKLSVVGNLAVDTNYGYHLGTYQILFRYNATGEFRIGTNAANDFTTFYANGIERMRLNASGYLGIGLTSPTQPLHVKGVLAYPKIIIDNNSTSGGGAFSAYQNGTETANFGISGAWLLDSSSDVAIVATRAGKGIQFYTNGSTSEKMGINSDGNVFIGQTPTYVAGATQLIVRGKTGAGYVGVNHYDMSIKGSMNTFNSVFQIGTSTFHSVAVIVEDIERARFNSGGRMLLGTTTDNTVDIFQANGSIIATAIKKTGGTSSQYLMADGSVSTGPSLAGYVPTSRTLTINGTSYDLSADRTWTIAGVISGLTTNYVTKATGATTIGNSQIFDNGTNVIIGGTTSSTFKLDVNGTARFANDVQINGFLTGTYTRVLAAGNNFYGQNITLSKTDATSNLVNRNSWTLNDSTVPYNGGVIYDNRIFAVSTTNSTLYNVLYQSFIVNNGTGTQMGIGYVSNSGGTGNFSQFVHFSAGSVYGYGANTNSYTTYTGLLVNTPANTTNGYSIIVNDFTPVTLGRGIELNLSSGTGKWNIFAQGTANNYMAGSLGIGTTSLTGYNLRVNKNITGGTTSYGISQTGIVQSDVTSFSFGNHNSFTTQAATFTLGTYYHFAAYQGTLGAGSTVTSQVGFYVDGSLIGATNDYGFYGNIPSGTNRWNLYMGGTANNFLAGSLGIGSTSLTGNTLRISKNITGSTTCIAVYQDGAVQSDVTSDARYFDTYAQIQNTAFTLTNLRHYRAGSATFGSATVTNQYAFEVASSLTSATNNYAFFSALAAGTGRWNLYMSGNANNYLAGSLGIGTTVLTGYSLSVIKNITGATTAYGIYQSGIVQSDVTGTAFGFNNFLFTQAATFTLNSYIHYAAQQATIGTGNTLNEQSGFVAGSTLTGATNNYGFRGSIASGSGRWNLYMVGTAQNYLAGDVGIGVTVNHASAKLQVDSTTEGFLPPRMTATQRGAIASPAEGLVVVQTDGTQGLYIYIGAAWHALTML